MCRNSLCDVCQTNSSNSFPSLNTPSFPDRPWEESFHSFCFKSKWLEMTLTLLPDSTRHKRNVFMCTVFWHQTIYFPFAETMRLWNQSSPAKKPKTEPLSERRAENMSYFLAHTFILAVVYLNYISKNSVQTLWQFVMCKVLKTSSRS